MHYTCVTGSGDSISHRGCWQGSCLQTLHCNIFGEASEMDSTCAWSPSWISVGIVAVTDETYLCSPQLASVSGSTQVNCTYFIAPHMCEARIPQRNCGLPWLTQWTNISKIFKIISMWISVFHNTPALGRMTEARSRAAGVMSHGFHFQPPMFHVLGRAHYTHADSIQRTTVHDKNVAQGKPMPLGLEPGYTGPRQCRTAMCKIGAKVPTAVTPLKKQDISTEVLITWQPLKVHSLCRHSNYQLQDWMQHIKELQKYH